MRAVHWAFLGFGLFGIAVAIIAWQQGLFGPGAPQETDFRAFTTTAAAERSTAYTLCFGGRDMGNKWDRQIGTRCMELRGYSYQPR